MDLNKQAQPAQAEISIQQKPPRNNYSKKMFWLFFSISFLIAFVVGGFLLGANKSKSQSALKTSQNQQESDEARKADIEIMVDMTVSRAKSELIYDESNSYGGINCSNAQLSPLCSSIEKLSGKRPTYYSNNNSYCGYVKLSQGYYCIDNNRSSKTDIDPSGENYCNGNTYVCPPASSQVSNVSASKTQQEIPSPTPDPTANWKTFTSQNYNFEIKYPNDWNHSSGVMEESFAKNYIKDSSEFSCLTSFAVILTGNFDNYLKSYYASSQSKPQQAAMNINGINAINMIGLPYSVNNLSYWVKRPDGKDFSVNIYQQINKTILNKDGVKTQFGYVSDPACIDIFNQILSTFRFSN